VLAASTPQPEEKIRSFSPDILIMSFVRELSATLFRASAVGNILKDSKRKNEHSSKFAMENTTGGVSSRIVRSTSSFGRSREMKLSLLPHGKWWN
jgi:hypothetical protein